MLRVIGLLTLTLALTGCAGVGRFVCSYYVACGGSYLPGPTFNNAYPTSIDVNIRRVP